MIQSTPRAGETTKDHTQENPSILILKEVTREIGKISRDAVQHIADDLSDLLSKPCRSRSACTRDEMMDRAEPESTKALS